MAVIGGRHPDLYRLLLSFVNDNYKQKYIYKKKAKRIVRDADVDDFLSVSSRLGRPSSARCLAPRYGTGQGRRRKEKWKEISVGG